MSLRIGDEAPDFTADSTHGTVYFHEWMTNSWAVLFYLANSKQINHLENNRLNGQSWQSEFEKRNAQCLGLSTENLETIRDWKDNLEIHQGYELTYPIISDQNQNIAKHYGMLTELQGTGNSDNFHYSDSYKLYLIAPDKSIKLMMNYPDTNTMEFSEILVLLDSIQAYSLQTDGTMLVSGHSQSFYSTTTLS